MSVLPTIKTPKFTLTLPVSKLTVKARPFLIREQKVLLQAMEVGDKDQVVNALDDIMQECTFHEIVVDDLPVPDVEYLMLHLRSKSVGEQIKMSYTCNNPVPDETSKDKDAKVPCKTKIPVVIPINDIKVDIPKDREAKLIFDGDIGIQLKDIPYGVYKVLSQQKESVEKTMKLRNSCIDKVFDANTVWTSDQFNDKDIQEFVDNLYSNDYDKIEAYIRSMPVLKHKVTIKCPKCGHTEEVVLRGLDDFLA